MKHKICVNVQDYVIPAATAVIAQRRSAINLTYALVLLQSLASSLLRLYTWCLTVSFGPLGGEFHQQPMSSRHWSQKLWTQTDTVNCKPAKERGGIVFDPSFRPREAGLSLWPLNSSLIPPCVLWVTPPLSSAFRFQTIGGNWHACTHWTEQLQCLSRRCVRHVDVSTKQLSLSPSSLASVLVWLAQEALNCTEVQQHPPAHSLSLCNAHSLLIWSSVGQCGSSERQECWQAGWLMKNRGEKSCTGSQVLFKMCYWPQNVNGRDSQHVKSTHCQNMN